MAWSAMTLSFRTEQADALAFQIHSDESVGLCREESLFALSVRHPSPSCENSRPRETIPHAKNYKILRAANFSLSGKPRLSTNHPPRLRKATRPRHLQTIHRNSLRLHDRLHH